jgi:hypothetical protein
MSFATQSIRYGWLALASLGVITGTTIYVASNQRKQVKPQDIIEIVVGTHERCLATQYSTNPVSYYVSPPSFVRTWRSSVYTTNGVTVYTNIVTNTIGFRPDRDMMVELDLKIKSTLLCYAVPNSIYEGSTNAGVSMLAVTGVWEQLGIGDKVDNFTSIPGSVGTNGITNAATYGDWSWRIYVTNFQERYKAIWAQEQTVPAVVHTNEGMYCKYGRGVGATWEDAYGDAAANYTVVAVPIDTPVKQHCKIAWWSNFWSQGGSGATNDMGDAALAWVPQGGTYDYLSVSATATGNIVVASSGISGAMVEAGGLNIIVTGDIYPNLTGTYTGQSSGNPAVWTCSEVGGEVLAFSPYSSRVILMDSSWTYAWETYGGFGSALVPSFGIASGTAYTAVSPFTTWVTGEVAAVDYSGTYYPKADYWHGGAGYIFTNEGRYVIYRSLALDANDAYLVSDGLFGEYDAVNFVADTWVSLDSGGLPPCVGDYYGSGGTYRNGSWFYVNSEDVNYITANPDIPPFPAWSKGGDIEGQYSPSGGGAYGDVQVQVRQWTAGQDEIPIEHLHIATIGGNVVSNFYECWLRKVVPLKTSAFLSTNIEHRARFWTRPIRPTDGTATNLFDDETLGLVEDVWNADAVDTWTDWTFSTPVSIDNYWLPDVDAAPDMPSKPAGMIPNTWVYSGFWALNWVGIADWRFNYCTEKYW